jgi:hypothetical protein
MDEPFPVWNRHIDIILEPKSIDGNRIGFCGKWYNFEILQHNTRGKFDGKIFFLHLDYNKLYMEELVKNKVGYYTSWGYHEIDKFSFKHKIDIYENHDLFIEHKTPVLIVCENSHAHIIHQALSNMTPEYPPGFSTAESYLVANPFLKNLDFFRVMDSFTAMQEIHMYLNGTLSSQVDPIMPVGSDEVLAASKGFDKFSFRKSKTKGV